MNRIDAAFARCREEKRAALVPYATAGFPDLETTERLLPALEADVIELGVPFSDPIADGPAIQKASADALANGATLAGVLDMLKRLRAGGFEKPVVLFGAYNPFFRMGLAECARRAADSGADGFLAADLPIEEADDFQRETDARGLRLIFLAAPTTPDARLKAIAARSKGFLYCIARRGITGGESDFGADFDAYMERLREAAGPDLPLAVGFGVRSPGQVRELAPKCDGVVVGTALIDAIREALGAGRDPVSEAAAFSKTLSEAI